MKHTVIALLVLLPVAAVAYPDPNVSQPLGAGDLVNSILSQPESGTIVVTSLAGS
ncbi:MAG: hypothetical protein NXH94_02645 [Rhodobacteraceae bacterium]|jgi:hypothetical protein|uniref:hypothetical protein n=1 Tax=Marivita sp. TaxID=2003365 RepID=UPI003B516012|nr:hypothetical protein [Paracoccaceae bacterium]